MAKPRLNRLLIQGRRQATGSKTGFIGSLSVGVTEGGQGTRPGSLSGENRALQNLLSMTRTVRDYYDDKYWDPEIYWTYQDAIWLLPAAGTVEVDPLRPASTSSDN